MIRIQPATVERLTQWIESTIDPTGTAPAWAFLPCGESPGPTSWVNGNWSTAYTPGNRAEAATPTVGAIGSGATMELGLGLWQVWLRVTAGADTAVRQADLVHVATGAAGGGSPGGIS